MAAMMGYMITRAGEQDRELHEVIALHNLLSPTGGVLTLNKAAGFLGMDTAELTLRMIDRSIMGVFVLRDLYVPLFQFQGQYHIPHFHDLWDVLAPSCSELEMAHFFVAETLVPGGPTIRQLLVSDPIKDVLQAIFAKASAFRSPTWR
ncbi:hypothetical protein RBE51_22400 [Pseudomonas taiwanensis]|uniref:hypothetical protein n=1 Tax=Pseudomonas taiwanensis TaxID=470150 RepID=UPI0028DD59D6|nr:hypothetical protein [Pseudomonas taiwanensis]MDT8925537.1 hypothetical protein [Pseudomonas taiwanensis]